MPFRPERRRRTLPIEPTASRERAKPSALSDVAPAVPYRRKSILVVEDDPVLLGFYKGALLMSGFGVTTAEDGMDALRWMESETPDLIVLDLGLPRVSGHDVYREITVRAETRHIPVVVVTGQAGVEAAHFACVLHKPVDAESLVSVVEKCLREARRR